MRAFIDRPAIFLFAVLALGGAACAEEEGSLDPAARADGGGSVQADAAPASPDGGALEPDAGTTTQDPNVETLEVGTVHIENGSSDPVAIDLPDGVTSFMLIIDGPDTAWYVPERFEGPNGLLVSDDASTVTQVESFLLGPFAAQFKSPNRVVQDLGLSASLFPNNPGITVTGGRYTLRVGGLVPTGQGTPFTGDVTVTIYLRRAAPSAGRIDVHLYFTGAGGISAASAPNDALIQGALQRLGEIYGQAAIELGSVDYTDVDPSFSTIRNLEGTGGDLEHLFELSAGHGAGLHYFFVDRFEAAFPGATVAGIAGGLPGAARHPGSVGAGVAVAIAPANGDSGVLAHVMAHEGGHWLGLFHTSEITGTEDQHPETPGGQAGQTHLMYPAVGGGTLISPSQATVLRSHAEVIGR